jgi:hypothetical protein
MNDTLALQHVKAEIQLTSACFHGKIFSAGRQTDAGRQLHLENCTTKKG